MDAEGVGIRIYDLARLHVTFDVFFLHQLYICVYYVICLYVSYYGIT